MCPFMDEDEEDDYTAVDSAETGRGSCPHFFQGDRKFFLVGGGASVLAFSIAAYFMYSSSKPINLEDLPVISADGGAFKIKPAANGSVKHQDKMVYDNISGESRVVKEKVVKKMEEDVLSIPEIEKGESLSDEEKKNIIKAFEALAPEKEYQIEYVKKDISTSESGSTGGVSRPLLNVLHSPKTNDPTPAVAPIKKSIPQSRNNDKKTKVDNYTFTRGSGFLVQIASVLTKSAAEVEYNRVLSRNQFLRGLGKKIVKVDLGEKKGIRYRVQVGPLKTREDAGRVVALMKRNGFSAYISK
ncbi:MAG: SPOR domain-containing protein [Holosporaceae bacterium]|jgi:cell division septation protein DedD|nr:SPOR domain-containing protein [Holosporaceae bacterium]